MLKLLPILLAVLGLGAGVGAGFLLRPAPEAEAEAPDAAAMPAPEAQEAEAPPEEHGMGGFEYVDLEDQFIVPLVAEGRVGAMVAISLSIEVVQGQSDIVKQRYPKLRDAFLRVMFDHANAGGFDGTFTEGGTVEDLRDALREAAAKVIGEGLEEVLITDLARHES